MKLHDLQPTDGSTKKRKRVGRGHGSGSGKTAGRGTKGQGARSGGGKGPYFEGGQLPLVRRLPFARGIGNMPRNRVEFAPVNLQRLAEYFEAGQEISPDTLAEVGIIKKPTQAVAILANGELDRAYTVKAHRVSKAAKAKIEAAGGSVEILSR